MTLYKCLCSIICLSDMLGFAVIYVDILVDIIFTRDKSSFSYSRYKAMDDKLIYIPNDHKQNYPFYRLKLLV